MKTAIFLFKNDPMTSLHVFLYPKELNEKGTAKLILEGAGTALPKSVEGKVRELYEMAKEKGWIDYVCRACPMATNSLEYNEKEELPLCSKFSSIDKYLRDGYTVLVF